MVGLREKVREYLLGIGWRFEVDPLGVWNLTAKDNEWSVEVTEDQWGLSKFTDGDIDGVAVGRYRSVEDGGDLDGLIGALSDYGIWRDCGYDPTSPTGHCGGIR